MELDGIARRMVLCLPDLDPRQLASLAAAAEIDAWVGDPPIRKAAALGISRGIGIDALPVPLDVEREARYETEWVLLTSGSTGSPKLVLHTLASLAGGAIDAPARGRGQVWSTFYDIRRYGGLQILLRATLGAGALVLSSAGEAVRDFLARVRKHGVTHISGTPSHWRSVLMSDAAKTISPRYVRLSGEIADQAVLDAVGATWPDAEVVHAFASTEAGVAFEVGDGLAGFPATLLGGSRAAVELKVERDTLRVRSSRNARRYLGDGAAPLAGDDGFVDTGDRVELREGRYTFVGRVDGVINVGGLKVHPEEIEAVINSHPRVRISLVRARQSPILGSVVAADVVPLGEVGEEAASELLEREILAACRRRLPRHKVPATIRFVPGLEVSAAGKLVRPGA